MSVADDDDDDKAVVISQVSEKSKTVHSNYPSPLTHTLINTQTLAQ